MLSIILFLLGSCSLGNLFSTEKDWVSSRTTRLPSSQPKRSSLGRAIAMGEIKRVEELINAGESLSKSNELGLSPLLLSIIHGQGQKAVHKEIEELLAKRATLEDWANSLVGYANNNNFTKGLFSFFAYNILQRRIGKNETIEFLQSSLKKMENKAAKDEIISLAVNIASPEERREILKELKVGRWSIILYSAGAAKVSENLFAIAKAQENMDLEKVLSDVKVQLNKKGQMTDGIIKGLDKFKEYDNEVAVRLLKYVEFFLTLNEEEVSKYANSGEKPLLRLVSSIARILRDLESGKENPEEVIRGKTGMLSKLDDMFLEKKK